MGARKNPAGKAAEATLKETGLIYSSSGLDEVHVSDDVRFSLRYSDDDHIARELGPLYQAAPRPAPAAEAGRIPASEHPGRADGHPPAGPGPVGWAMHVVGGGSHRPGALPRTPGPVPQAATMNAAPSPASCNGPETAITARTNRWTCRCLDGAAPPAVMPAWRGQKMAWRP